ncbi:MAG TPA: Tex family protein [Ignavibacteriaceae bacterium]|nr:Tex family protein [Ignavibacteriaceae bacterium]
MNIPSIIANELKIRNFQVDAVIRLFSEGATVPFIARYRKEHTGGLDEDALREIEDRLNYLTLVNERRATILKSIEEQGKLTDEIRNKLNSTLKLQELEDIYLPFKPKRKTRGTVAKAKGLEPLALFILQNPLFKGNFDEKLSEFINPELDVNSMDEALQGAKDIIAEMLSDMADVRKIVREYLLENSLVKSEKTKEKKESMTNEKLKDRERKEIYQIYYDFNIDIKKIKPYQVLAVNRGEKEKVLKISLSFDQPEVLLLVKKSAFEYRESVFMNILDEVVEDSFMRLIFPSIEREIRNQLTENADLHAIEIFASNLRQLLLQPPLSGKIIMGIDPGFVSGSKIAIINETGKYLEGITIYPHPPQNKSEDAKKILLHLIEKYRVEVVAIGNGTASRETEFLIAALIKDKNLKCHYIIVNEAGASVYSASEVAKQEFPDLEASQRGNISIARRILDPLSELVKIDPKSIGVGLYQHDVDQKLLSHKLDNVVESCVNYVGVDLNTASISLLTYVSGLNKRIAANIVKYRENKGRFNNREELKEVTGLGDKIFEQSAGFLKIPGSENPFDNTFIHPESYIAAEKLLKLVKLPLSKVAESGSLIDLFVKQKGTSKLAEEIGIGEPTLIDILENLKKPGRDPREELPKPLLRSDVLKMEDLQVGMVLKGTVRNIVDFGAFVDIGVKQDGLLHISEIADKYVKNPLEVLSVGEVIDVKIISVDVDRGRISLSRKS